MIKIFDENDRDFSTNGNIAIKPTKCKEIKKKSLNGWYIEVEVDIKYADYIQEGKLCVVKTKSKLNPQAFRIENPTKTSKKITFTANHVMFDAKRYHLYDIRPTNQSGQNALSYINERTDNISPFVVFSNVENISTAYFIRKSLLEAWAVIEERWNGVFDADNWNISMLNKVGNDNGETIAYKKNMQGIQIFEDWSNVCTKICPVGYDGITLPEKYIESDIQYPIPYTKTIDFETELEEAEMSEEALIEELRVNANKYIEENKYPKVSYEVTSNINQNMEIGDTIQVKHPLITILTEVLEYQHNILTKKIESLVFGNYKRDVKTKFDAIKENIKNIANQYSKQEATINKQTELINSLNKTGYVYIDENEIMITDTLPIESAKNVWRFGLGGIGFSSNGCEGPFETAITMDGQINANFITTGVLSVDRIEGLSEQISLVVSSKVPIQGGDNVFRYAEDNFVGEIEEYSDTDIKNNTVSGLGYKIKSGNTKQVVQVKNGIYTISLLYKKLKELASGAIIINKKRYDLTAFGENFIEQVFNTEVTSNILELEIESDTDDAFIICDVMGNLGNVKMTWTQNANETITDTVTIGKGMTIKSNVKKTILKADADGVRINNSITNETKTEFTDKGMITDEIKANKAQLSGMLVQQVSNQVWLSSLL